jgi:hypothetical protein
MMETSAGIAHYGCFVGSVHICGRVSLVFTIQNDVYYEKMANNRDHLAHSSFS